MIAGVEVTYQGPSQGYSVEHDGKWYEFVSGRAQLVPEPLAERLLDVPGHTFEVADEIERAEQFVTEVLGSGSGSGEGSGSGDVWGRVNAA